MRIIPVLLMIGFLQLSASSLAQQVSLSMEQASLRSVLAEVSRQTGYKVVYQSDLIDKAALLSLRLRQAPLPDAMQRILTGQPFDFLIDDREIIIKPKEKSLLDRINEAIGTNDDVQERLIASQQPITGRVTDSLGNPLAGATVKIATSIQGVAGKATFTDKDGRFILRDVETGATLLISYLGYVTKEMKADGDLGDVVLVAVSAELEEASVEVSTGFQKIPKERATGSFSHIDNATFNQQVSTDVLSRLEAVANGLMVDRGTNTGGRISIRGLSTIRGPKEPLIIVDNFPYSGDINNLNPNIIEDITILKDAAAASIWGAKAGNGVIVITTKKGKYNQALFIDFNSNVTIGDRPNLSAIPLMSSSDFIDVEQALYKEGFYTAWKNSVNKQILSPVVELLTKMEEGSISEAEGMEDINALRNLDVKNDFNKYIYQKSVNQQYALSMRGGSEQMSWTATAGYDDNSDDLDVGFNRLNLRYQQTYKPLSSLQLTSEIYYTQSSNHNGRPGYGSITQQGNSILPYAQFADESGNPLPIFKTYRQSYLDNVVQRDNLLNWDYYPLEDFKNDKTTSTLSDVLINTGLNYRLIKGINLDIKYQYERQNTNDDELNNENSYYTRDLINSFTQISETGDTKRIIPLGGIFDFSNSMIKTHNLRGQININQTWGKNEISAIAGGELLRTNSTGHSSRYYGYNEDILTFGNVDYTMQYPNYVSGYRYTIPNNLGVNERQTNYVSYFANASYTLSGKYITSLSSRRDASNLFGLNTNDQWNPFWSVGIGWIISKERFFDNEIIPYLKFRATFGASGNIDPAMTAVTTIQYISNSDYTQSPYSIFNSYNNPELRWETSKTLNFGLDFGTKNNHLSGSVEYYQKYGKNLFGNSLLDYTVGINSIIKNAASMQGQGLDIELKTLFNKGFFGWSSFFNLSLYNDKVTDYYLTSTRGSSFMGGNVPISGIKDRPVYAIYSYKWAGLDPLTGDPQGNIDGKVSKDYNAITGNGTQVQDLKYFGSALPTFFGSFGNTFTFKNLSFNFSFVYKLGYYFRRRTISYSALYDNWVGNSDFAKRWQNPGDEKFTNVPSMIYPNIAARDAFYSYSEPLVEKADHVRLQYLNLAYTFKDADYPFLPFKTFQVFVNVDNVGIIWRANKSNIDPDSYYLSNYLAEPRNYSIGLKVNFK